MTEDGCPAREKQLVAPEWRRVRQIARAALLLFMGLAGAALVLVTVSIRGAGLDWTVEQLETWVDETWVDELLDRSSIPRAKDPDALVECSEGWPEGVPQPEPYTEEQIARAPGPRWVFDGDPVELDSELRARVLSAAESWAHENCYLPCEEQMCGEILSSRLAGHVKLHLRNEGLYRAIEKDDVWWGPEALVLVRIDPMAAVDAIRIHSGCASLRPDC